MATPFPFVSGAVLTAAQMNAITELVINDKTDSYTLVAGDAGEYVVMNKATSSTITVPNSVFTAGQIVRIVNKGAGVCTVTAGAGTTVSTTGSLALAQNATGTLIALSASAFIFEAGGVTASSGALTYITGGSFSAAASFSLTANTFSATYANYLVLWDFTASSSVALTVRMRASGSDNTTSNYNSAGSYTDNAGNTTTFANNGGTSFSWSGAAAGVAGRRNTASLTVFGPQASQFTGITATGSGGGATGGGIGGYQIGGNFQDTTSFDSLSVIVASGNITGTYRVYGYANS